VIRVRGRQFLSVSVGALKSQRTLGAAIGLCCLLLACTPAYSPERYVAHYTKNRRALCRSVERNGVSAEVVYVPNEYYAARDMVSDRTLGANKALERYQNSLFLVLSVRPETPIQGSVILSRGDRGSFQREIARNSFGRDSDAFLVDGLDTVRAIAWNYDRNWGIGNEDSFLLAFPRNRLRGNPQKYRLIVRNTAPELGTIDMALSGLLGKIGNLKG